MNRPPRPPDAPDLRAATVGPGGGLYNQAGALAFADAHTKIKGNKATTNDDDVFGT